jgi:hypothetical protein
MEVTKKCYICGTPILDIKKTAEMQDDITGTTPYAGTAIYHFCPICKKEVINFIDEQKFEQERIKREEQEEQQKLTEDDDFDEDDELD